MPPAGEAWSLNHSATREVPGASFLTSHELQRLQLSSEDNETCFSYCTVNVEVLGDVNSFIQM